VFATLVAVGLCLLLAFGAGGGSGSGGLVIWPLFGSTNQILAGLTLLVITVMLIKLGRPARYTMLPMIFVLVTSFWAGAVKLVEFYRDGNYLLLVIDAIVLITSVLVMLEAASVISRFRRSGTPGSRCCISATCGYAFSVYGPQMNGCEASAAGGPMLPTRDVIAHETTGKERPDGVRCFIFRTRGGSIRQARSTCIAGMGNDGASTQPVL
jgi:hypothetical protein